jgi:hypothetical protein
MSPRPALYYSRWGLEDILPRVASNHDLLDLHLPSCWDCRMNHCAWLRREKQGWHRERTRGSGEQREMEPGYLPVLRQQTVTVLLLYGFISRY